MKDLKMFPGVHSCIHAPLLLLHLVYQGSVWTGGGCEFEAAAHGVANTCTLSPLTFMPVLIGCFVLVQICPRLGCAVGCHWAQQRYHPAYHSLFAGWQRPSQQLKPNATKRSS